MVCPACQFSNPPGNRFCNACGLALAEGPADARRTTPRAYTPKHLAEKILSSRAALEGERKQVTVLFADVVDFTGLAEGKDPEDVHLLMDEVFAILLDTVHRYEGTINQFLGDGVMALFGAPVALEDHALRAVQAALEIQERIAAGAAGFRVRFGAAPALRIGLNSGRVVVGKIGDDLRMDYTAQGDTVNLAARLQQVAEAGRVAMGPATRRLVADSVECVSLGLHAVKGRTEPVEVFSPVRALDRGELMGASADRGLSPFIGREDELSLLLALFDEVSSGQARTAIVTGEAGAGKSRLLMELRRRIDQPGLQWFVGHCVPYGRSTPYRPIVKSIRAACALQEGASRQVAVEALDALLAPLGDRRNEVAPVIRYLLGLQPSDAELSPLSAADRRAAITRALDAVIEVLVARGPLVLVWEDCQWLDPVSTEYLASIAQRLPPGPILFMLTYRPEASGQAVVRPPGEDLLLRPLTASEATALVMRLAGDQLPPVLVTLAVDRAGGNPLFLEEVTRTLMESGTDSVPPTVEALLRARIDRLAPRLKAVLGTAAIIGQEFSRVLLEQVVGEAQDLTATLHELVEEGLLAESEVSTDVFHFRQPLLQEVAYDGWLTHRRKMLHRQVGETIERLYPHRLFEHLEKLARHFTRSEEWARAVYYHQTAGRKAATLCANREAIQRFERALEMLERLPESLDRAGQAIDLRLDLCSPSLQLGRLDEVLRLCGETEPLAKALGDQRRLADVYSHLSNYHYMKGEPDTATEFGRLCLSMSTGIDEASFPHSPRQYLGTCYHVLGRYPEAVTVLTEHIEAIERGDEFKRFGPTNLSYVSSCGWLAFTLAELGEFARAHQVLANGTGAAAMTGHAYVQAIASTFAGLVWHTQGELDRAVPILRQSLDTCLEHQIVVWRPIVAALLGHAHTLQGRVPHGLDLLGEAAALTEQLQVLAYRALWTAHLAEALLVAGQLPAALETARRAADLAVQHKERGNHARALVVLGTACLRLGPASFEQARDYLQQAFIEAEQLQMRPLLARCYDMLGRLADEQGETATAWQLRETSKTIQRELGLIAWWDALVEPPPAAGERAPELRRHPRAPLAWPVTVDTGQRRLYLHTTNMSTVGAKVRSSEALQVGTSAHLHFQRPDGRPLDVQATVSRADADGVVFAFDGAVDRELQLSLGSGKLGLPAN
jgi:class 3 adenylate cyclase/tetratricopeptide (TPR) repeat protein